MLLLSSAASLFVCWLRNMMGFGSYISCITQLVDRGGMMCIGVIVSLLNNAQEFIQVDFLILNIVRVCSSLTTVPDTIGCSHTIYSATITIITVNEGAIGFQSRDCL